MTNDATANNFIPSEILHGVFLDVLDLGTLLQGASGIGKSELALELINRGHKLIADDAPEFQLTESNKIYGHCPPVLKDFIEVRGLGILNLRAMFGDKALSPNKRLQLIIRLESNMDKIGENAQLWESDRLGSMQHMTSVLNIDIPEIKIPVAPGRNIAIVIEAAVRNHLLYLDGYNAAEDFIQRQQEAINSE
ncbi:MAG: hypothetical protein QM484_02795 [Woeseiaceae bacterium]